MPRNLFGSDSRDDVSDGAHMSDEGSKDAEEVAPGTQVTISAEGYANDTNMLAMCLDARVWQLAEKAAQDKQAPREVQQVCRLNKARNASTMQLVFEDGWRLVRTTSLLSS